MKSLAHRTEGLMQSGIRSITKLVNEVNGINLGQGICDMPTPDAIKAGAIQAVHDDHSIYTAYTGIAKLQAAIYEKAKAFNRLPCASRHDVMVSAGSTGAFVTAMFTLFEPGDEIILFEPFYGYHRNLLPLCGVTQRIVTLQPPDWGIDFDALEAAITPKTKAILVCTPANPCGKVWARQELTQLLVLLEKHDLYALTDEIYEYMVYDGHAHISLGSLPGAYERTITISGFSKTYNMTGWRLGYAVGPQPIIDKMGLLNDLFYICAPSPLQYGVAEAFSMPDTYFTEMLAAYTTKRKMLCEALEAIGFEMSWPQGSYYILANFERFAQTHEGFENDQAACEALIRSAGVASIPGRAFFEDPEDGRYFLRFCYAKEEPVLARACQDLVNAFVF